MPSRINKSTLLLSVTILFLFLTVSCSDDPDPVSIIEPRDTDCVNYQNYLHIAGYYDTRYSAYGIAVSGAYAYVASDLYGLEVLDISSPSSPVSLGYVDTPGNALGNKREPRQGRPEAEPHQGGVCRRRNDRASKDQRQTLIEIRALLPLPGSSGPCAVSRVTSICLTRITVASVRKRLPIICQKNMVRRGPPRKRDP